MNAAVEAPPVDANPQEHFARLRAWAVEHCVDQDPVRRAATHMALSAVAHRLLKYGPDESLNSCSSKELMTLLLFLNGPLAEYVMRAAYFRAIIEGEHAIYEHFNQALFIPECRAWYWTIAEAMIARSPDPEAVTTWLENMTGEERSVARLVIVRVFPDVAHIDWLADIPDVTQPQFARLGAELCKILIGKPEYVPLVKNYLRAHPHVRYSVADGTWPKL